MAATFGEITLEERGRVAAMSDREGEEVLVPAAAGNEALTQRLVQLAT